MGRSQFVNVTDQVTIIWVRWLLLDMHPECKIWRGTRPTFARWLKAVLTRIGCNSMGLSPGCLRPGGATLMSFEGHTSLALAERGRWKNESSMLCYLNEALCAYVWSTADDGALARVKSLVSYYHYVLDKPPLAPWTSLFSRSQQWMSR